MPWNLSQLIILKSYYTPKIINYTYQPSPFNIHILPPPRSHPTLFGRRVANCPDILACFDTSPAAAWRKVHSLGRGSAPAPADPRAPWMGEAFASGGGYTPNGFRNGEMYIWWWWHETIVMIIRETVTIVYSIDYRYYLYRQMYTHKNYTRLAWIIFHTRAIYLQVHIVNMQENKEYRSWKQSIVFKFLLTSL